MTGRERFIRALKRQPISGHVPHFELVFYLTMEVLGRVHPQHQVYGQWTQMSQKEQDLHIDDMAHAYIDIARKYHHDAIFVHTDIFCTDITVPLIRHIRDLCGDEFFLMVHGDGTFEIPTGSNMVEFSARFFEEPEVMKRVAKERIDSVNGAVERLLDAGAHIDGVAMCSDYCFNDNPFFSPTMFREFVFPYLKEQIDRYHARGIYVIKHTDGNIMPILDQLVEAGPDALHSLDPQGGVDLAEVKRLYGDRVSLIGNVNCGLLQTGSEEEVEADVRRALRQGMEGYGYVFATSNCVYTGLDLDRYELMNRIWWEEGVYA